jgi:predicted MFS family arabinose efflux permease
LGPRRRALLGFAAFGTFWGAWGAALPAVQRHAAVDDAQLGLALLCVGAGALLSMRATGRTIDRWGARVVPAALALMAAGAVLPGVAGSPLALAGALLVLGVASGAVDVAINAEAARAEHGGDPLLNLAHGLLSASVVATSVLVGLLRDLSAGAAGVLGLAAAVLLAAAFATAGGSARPAPATPPRPRGRVSVRWRRPIVVLGLLCALAYLVENASQSWGGCAWRPASG